jgi:hypothetical protein
MTDDLTTLLERERLCLDCLARALKRRRDRVADALNALRRAFRLRAQPAICRPCASLQMTYNVVDPPIATRASV